MSMYEDLLSNNRFKVCIGPLCFSFSKVSNISHSIAMEEIQEGGMNDTPSFLFAPKKNGDKLILERGVQTGFMANMAAKVFIPGLKIFVCTVIVLDKKMGVAKTYTFDEGVVTKWDIDDLEAMDNHILVRRVEITHSGLYELF